MARQAKLPTLDEPDTAVASGLAAFDWSFPGRVAHSGIEGLHPYPAKFVAELPRALLDTLPIPPESAVLDPFCGSGTTLVESQRSGLPSIGIDLNPVACLMTRVKTAPLPADLPSSANEAVDRARAEKTPPIPLIPNLDHWFLPSVQQALAALTQAIAVSQPAHHDALRLALSSIIVRVSNQDSDTRYAAVNKDVNAEDVFRAFLRAAKRLHDVLSSRSYPLVPSEVIHADTLAVRPQDVTVPIGVVITSPPYPNAYEYWLYHKYRMWWLGFDPVEVKEHEIGARAHFFKRNHHTEADFEQQMTQTFELIDSVLVPGGYVCFVVGTSRIHGRIVDNASIVEDVAHKFDLHRVFSVERSLSSKRKSFNLAHARIKTETVLVMQ